MAYRSGSETGKICNSMTLIAMQWLARHHTGLTAKWLKEVERTAVSFGNYNVRSEGVLFTAVSTAMAVGTSRSHS